MRAIRVSQTACKGLSLHKFFDLTDWSVFFLYNIPGWYFTTREHVGRGTAIHFAFGRHGSEKR